jgi:uncharacterized protein
MRRSLGFPLVILFAIVLAIGSFSAPAAAQSLDDLRASGAVGERFDGFAVARDSSAADVVAGINAKRKKIYGERAASQGVSAEEVGKVYAQKIFQKAPAGTWIQAPDGSWTQK